MNVFDVKADILENLSSQEKPKKDPEIELCKHPGLGSITQFFGRQVSVDYNNFTSEGKFLYREDLAKRIPDQRALALLQSEFLSWSYKFKRVTKAMKIPCLILDDRLPVLSWFCPTARHNFFKLIGRTLESQRQLECLTAEFGNFMQGDGLKLFLAIALAGGTHLKNLYVWRLFKPGELPVDLSDRSLEDVFVKEGSLEKLDPELLNCLWQEFVIRNDPFRSKEEKMLSLKCSLMSLNHLTVLSVDYSHLVTGQGSSLCQLGCITTGTLKYLKILYTEVDHPNVSRRHVSEDAWRLAVERNPNFKVHLAAIRMGNYCCLSKILTRYMPLEKLFVSSGLSEECRIEGLRFDLTTRLIIERYTDHFKGITLHLRFDNIAIDLAIRKFLKELPHLEEFEFMGPFNRTEAIHTMLEEVVENYKGLKKFHASFPVDKISQETVESMYAEFKNVFHLRHIDFQLKTCYI